MLVQKKPGIYRLTQCKTWIYQECVGLFPFIPSFWPPLRVVISCDSTTVNSISPIKQSHTQSDLIRWCRDPGQEHQALLVAPSLPCKVTLWNKGSALPAFNHLPVFVQKKKSQRSDKWQPWRFSQPPPSEMFAQHSYDLVWLSCYVSITITHIASSESSASSQANVTNRLAARGWS